MVRAGLWAGSNAFSLVDSPTRMANIKSQKKRNIQNEKRRQRNLAAKTSLKTSTKKVHTAVAAGEADEAVARQREAARALDKAASKGVLHKKTAARKKSRLAKAANAVPA
jgi:small subunit ribosomal protein S20